MLSYRYRITYAFAFICCLCLLLFAYYLEYWQNITPCPLCLLQRFCYYFLAITFFVALFTEPNRIGRIIFGIIAIIFSLLGIIIAIRQLYLQHLPPNHAQGCSADISYLLQTFSLPEVLHRIFQGSAECSISQWSFLSLDMAAWSLIWLCFFILLAVYTMLQHRQ